jgi:RNA exonuclease 1
MTLITPSADYLRELREFVEPDKALQKHGFVTQPLTDEELLQKRRCVGCGKSK